MTTSPIEMPGHSIPVLSLDEAASHAHNTARGLYAQTSTGERRTRAAPRFTPLQVAHAHD